MRLLVPKCIDDLPDASGMGAAEARVFIIDESKSNALLEEIDLVL